MNGSHCLGNRVFSSLIIETWRATGRSPECDQNIASKFCQLQWQPKVLDVVARKEYNTRQVLGTHTRTETAAAGLFGHIILASTTQ